MGYYTAFELMVIEGDESLISELVEGDENAAYAIDEGGDTNESCTWYSHEHDMKKFSKKHPHTVFQLHGDGEENGDLWYKYFKGGKMQTCKAIITFDGYDESKLA